MVAGRGPAEADGPPWTETMSGYFLEASKSLGKVSQPWTWKPSFSHSMDSMWAVDLGAESLRWVIWWNLSQSPAHTSAGTPMPDLTKARTPWLETLMAFLMGPPESWD